MLNFFSHYYFYYQTIFSFIVFISTNNITPFTFYFNFSSVWTLSLLLQFHSHVFFLFLKCLMSSY